MKSKVKNSYYGKYREIIIAVVLFLVLDISVLIFNFYTSFQIDQDTVSINLSGRQRYVSQRVARTLLELDAARMAGTPYRSETITELRNGAKIFQISMMAFKEGGIVPGGDNKPVKLNAVTSPKGRQLEAQIEAVWNPYYKLLEPILKSDRFAPEQLAVALAYSQANNLKLLGLANDFVTETQAIGASRASQLRMIQTIGILMSLLNFVYTVFASLRQLLKNDRKVEAARKETTEILGTVKDGLFLLDKDFTIGSQFSESLEKILGRTIHPNTDFRILLKEMVTAKTAELAFEYIELLFGDRVKEALVADLNPLSSIEVVIPDGSGHMARRFLKLEFNRVLEEKKISHLLVTVVDVTVQVELEEQLALANQKAKAEMEIMLNVLQVNPATLEQFLKNAEMSLLDINSQLKAIAGSSNYRTAINTIFRKIHTLKGEAAALGLEMFENLAQQFETLLVEIREKGEVRGEDLLALPFPLEEFLQRVAMVRSLVERLAAYHDTFSAEKDETFSENLLALAKRIAADQGKEVELVAELDLLQSIPHKTRTELKDIALQLLRNAVSHGIEPAIERTQFAKAATGNIHIALKPTSAGEYELTLRDDGRGLVPQRIRAALLRSQRYTEQQLNQLSDQQVIMKIFESGFSTAEHATKDAGHGVGMDVVKNKVEQLGAKLRISSRENAFTQFSIQFAV